MEGKQLKLFYLFVLGAALLSVLLLMTAKPPGGKAPVKAVNKTAAGGGTPAVADTPVEKKPAQSPPARPTVQKPLDRGRLSKQKTVTVETDRYRATVSNLNAGLIGFRLKGERYRDESGEDIDLVTTDKEEYFPLRAEFEDLDGRSSAIAEDAFWEIEKLSRGAARLNWSGGGIRVSRKLEAGTGPFQLWITTTVSNRGEAPRRLVYGVSAHHYVDRKRETSPIPLISVPSPEVSKGLCVHAPPVSAGEVKSAGDPAVVRREHDQKEPEAAQTIEGSVVFAGVENVYFLKAVASHPGAGRSGVASCRLDSSNRGLDQGGKPLGTLFSAFLRYPTVTLPPGAAHTYRELAFLGPKMPDDLAKAGHGFPRAIDFGFFAILSEALSWLLRMIHGVVGNWGVAIILLTLLVKVCLYPLTAKSFQSMAQMRVLKPEMDRINELYKDDREKKGAATMELWRKHKINPMKGCLPQLLQLPIWIALYTSLRTNVELYHAPFTLWWTDLSSPDPFYVLPLALGVLMFVQQKMTPMATVDPVQAKMMLYGMPIMLTAFMLFLPAGLSLYILTNSALSIGQQRLIQYRLEQTAAAGASPGAETPPPAGSAADSLVSSAEPVWRIKKSKSGKTQRRSRNGRKK